MRLEEVTAELGLERLAERLRPGWEASQEALPAEGPPFLRPEFVAAAAQDAGVPEDVGRQAADLARRAADSPALTALAWHFHHRAFFAPPADYDPWDELSRWPSLEPALGDDAGVFLLVVLLSGVPEVRRVHQRHGVPPEVVDDTLHDVKHGFARPHKLAPTDFAWLSIHLRGELYRLGRLQFQFTSFGFDLQGFRHQQSGAVLALSADGVRYGPEGQLERRGESGWAARLTVAEQEVVGHPILPTGRALPRSVRLPIAEWRPEIAVGEPVLALHIPDGGPLSHPACGESLQRAVGFFARHFSQRPFRAFCCDSWILNTGLEELLPPEANRWCPDHS